MTAGTTIDGRRRCLLTRHCPAEIVVGREARALDQVAGLEVGDLEAPLRDKAIDWAVQMAAADEPSPERRQPVLPAANTGFGCLAVLDEDQSAARPQHAAGLRQHPAGLGDAAKRPGSHHAVDAVVLQGQRLGRTAAIDRHPFG